MPAVAASRVPAAKTPEASAWTFALRAVEEPPDRNGSCVVTTKFALEPRDGCGALRRKRALPSRSSAERCPDPP